MVTLDSLPQHSRAWTQQALSWMDAHWDETLGLLYNPGMSSSAPGDKNETGPPKTHSVRSTIWYAAGLLLRNQPGDVSRANRAIEAVLSYQFDAPTQIYHGTFARTATDPLPPDHPVIWKDYDPNWREFIGTTLALILQEYTPLLTDQLISKIDDALRKATLGTLSRDLSPEYTNIALMRVFLLDFAGHRFSVADWCGQAKQLAEKVYRLFATHWTFSEFNSPTYYGINLYALGLWRRYASSAYLRELGNLMEVALWQEIEQFYHAGLKNMCGPFDRSYYMDMNQYISGVGLWIAQVVKPPLAPLPDLSQPFAQSHDLCLTPLTAIVGTPAVAATLAQLTHFTAERQLERTIATAPYRAATAWLGAGLMLGGAIYQTPHAPDLFCPATVHWQLPNATVGTIRLHRMAPIQAVAKQKHLWIICAPATEAIFSIEATGATPAMIQADLWALPGLTLQVKTNSLIKEIVNGYNSLTVSYLAPEDSESNRLTFSLVAV